jgi:hypothetical protein
MAFSTREVRCKERSATYEAEWGTFVVAMVPVDLWRVCAHVRWTRTQSSQMISYAQTHRPPLDRTFVGRVARLSLSLWRPRGARAGTRQHGRRTGFVTLFGRQAREYIRLRASSANFPRLQWLPVLRLRSLTLPMADLFNARLPRFLGKQQPSSVKSSYPNLRGGLQAACGTGSIPGSQVRCVRKKRSSAALSS